MPRTSRGGHRIACLKSAAEFRLFKSGTSAMLPTTDRLTFMCFQMEDATFQVYKDGDYGNYLDVEASLNEQSEELEGFLEK